MTINGQTIQDILIAIALIGGVFVYARGRIPQQTIKNLAESNKSYVTLDLARQTSIKNLELQIKSVIDKHNEERLELNKAIADLQGQVKVYKELPLRELADGIKDVVIGNKAILNVLQKSAKTLTTATADAAIHVEEVRQDLAGNK